VFSTYLDGVVDLSWRALGLSTFCVVMRKPPTISVLKAQNPVASSFKFKNPIAQRTEMLVVPDFSGRGHSPKQDGELRFDLRGRTFQPIARFLSPVEAHGVPHGPPVTAFDKVWIDRLNNHSLVLTELQ
jgi:hypothetical protein